MLKISATISSDFQCFFACKHFQQTLGRKTHLLFKRSLFTNELLHECHVFYRKWTSVFVVQFFTKLIGWCYLCCEKMKLKRRTYDVLKIHESCYQWNVILYLQIYYFKKCFIILIVLRIEIYKSSRKTIEFEFFSNLENLMTLVKHNLWWQLMNSRIGNQQKREKGYKV